MIVLDLIKFHTWKAIFIRTRKKTWVTTYLNLPQTESEKYGTSWRAISRRNSHGFLRDKMRSNNTSETASTTILWYIIRDSSYNATSKGPLFLRRQNKQSYFKLLGKKMRENGKLLLDERNNRPGNFPKSTERNIWISWSTMVWHSTILYQIVAYTRRKLQTAIFKRGGRPL